MSGEEMLSLTAAQAAKKIAGGEVAAGELLGSTASAPRPTARLGRTG
jgi:hypothetical protein